LIKGSLKNLNLIPEINLGTQKLFFLLNRAKLCHDANGAPELDPTDENQPQVDEREPQEPQPDARNRPMDSETGDETQMVENDGASSNEREISQLYDEFALQMSDKPRVQKSLASPASENGPAKHSRANFTEIPSGTNYLFPSLLTNVGTIVPYNGLPTEDTADWIHQFDWVAEVNHWPQEVRCALFSNYLSGIAKEWYSTLDLATKKDYKLLCAAFLVAFQPVTSAVQHLHDLVRKVQKDDESVESYAYQKLRLCAKVDHEMPDQEKKLFLIEGLKPAIRMSVMERKPQTLDIALHLAREKENSLKLGASVDSKL
jgi:hypothetical protein